MRKISFRDVTLIVMLLVAQPLFCAASSAEDPASRLLIGQEKLLRRDYQGALEVFQSLQKNVPSSPAGFFGEMATYEIRMLEREDFHLEKQFSDAARRGERAVNVVLQKYAPTSDELMFTASLYGLKGFFAARKGEWLRAYLLGTKSRQIFRRIKQRDPVFFDADFGDGMYLYWRSVFAHRLTFLSFIPDRRADGIRLVQSVAARGRIAQELARVNLAMIFFEEQRYSESRKLFAEYVERYPHNILLRSFLGRVLLADKRYADSIGEFHKLVEAEPSFHKAHYFIAVNRILAEDEEHWPEAEERLARFMASQPNAEWRSYVHYWRGYLAEKRGDRARALQEYAQAVKLNARMKAAAFRMRGLGGGL